MFKFTINGIQKGTDPEGMVNSFDEIHFVYEMLLSNFLKVTHRTFYCLMFFCHANSHAFAVAKSTSVLAHCHWIS